MGLKGKIYALSVKVEYLPTHTASLPLAIAFSCWAHRVAKARIYSPQDFEILDDY